MDNKKTTKQLVVVSFLIVPFLSSFISTIHLIDFFSLGNFYWMGVILAMVYEVGSITSFIIPFILTKVKKNMLWTIFLILVFMQIVGNIYFSFNYINEQLLTNIKWLASFDELIKSIFGEYFILNSKLLVSLMIGIPIPIISLFFLKSMIDYVFPNKENEIIADIKPIITEEIKINDKTDDININNTLNESELNPGIYNNNSLNNVSAQ